MILIGSRALMFRAPQLLKREPKDFDFIAYEDEAIEWLKKEEQAFEIFKLNNALVAHNDGKFLLLLRKVRDDWDYWEILLHETHHITWYLAEGKMFQKEMEAQAYLQEYLFHAIRRKIMGIDSKK